MELYELINLLDRATEEQLRHARVVARCVSKGLARSRNDKVRAKIYRALGNACDARLEEIRAERTKD